MTPFAIAGIQMQLGHGSNIEAMRQRIDLTMHLYPWVQMVMFSELACFGPLLQHAQPLPGAAEEAFQDIARHHRIWLVNGSMYERRDGGIYNTTSVINPDGEVVGRYRKMFPFLPLEQGVAGRRSSSSPGISTASASSASSTATTSGFRKPRASSPRWVSKSSSIR